ncbi:MAG: type II toxin-antitoxin system prevent-host-death family antitoxin [Casimicrobiaceae bacterium]
MSKRTGVIGAYEAKTKLPAILRRVEAGERFTITNRGVPVAELRPVAGVPEPSAREAVSRMKQLAKIAGVGARAMRALIDEGRR